MVSGGESAATLGLDLRTGEATDAFELRNQSFQPSYDLLKIIYVLIGGLGLFGNGFVVVVIVNFRSMLKSVPNLFIVNQSLLDATASLFLLLMFTIPVDGNHVGEGILGDLLCKLWITQSVMWIFMISSTYNLVLVSLERYACVVYPIWHKKHVTRRRALCAMCIVWFIGFTIDWPFTFPSTKVIDGQCLIISFWPNDSVRRLMGMYMVIFLFIVPLAVFIFCYGRIASVLRSKVKPSGSAHDQSGITTNAGADSNMKAKARINVLKTLVVVVVITVVTWGMAETYFALYNLGLDYPYIDFTSPVSLFTIVMIYLNCCINPFVYAAQYQKFRQGVRLLFRMQPRQNQATSTSSGSY